MDYEHFYSDAVVGLEKTFYSISEDDPQGVVEVCVIVYRANNNNCPIPFSFDVNISTVEDSEGIILSGNYIPTVYLFNGYYIRFSHSLN